MKTLTMSNGKEEREYGCTDNGEGLYININGEWVQKIGNAQISFRDKMAMRRFITDFRYSRSDWEIGRGWKIKKYNF